MFASIFCRAQMNHPKASPFSTITQEVGLSEITVEYSRPAARGRVLFGNKPNGEAGLVPFGRIWRVGANESTKITFDTDIRIAGEKLKKGTYALYAFPQETEWQIVFHKNITYWGDGRAAYDSKDDALRINVTPIETIGFQENFLILFDAISHNEINMIWQWGRTKVTIPIQVDTQLRMQEQILNELKSSPTAQTYYEIARYYQEQGLRLADALKYVSKAIKMEVDTYYFYRVKSLILADLKEYSKAIKAAEISKILAEKENKDEFVRMNMNNIIMWENIQSKNN